MKDQLEKKSIEEIVRIKPVILLIDRTLGVTGGKSMMTPRFSVYIPDYYLILRIIYYQWKSHRVPTLRGLDNVL